MFIRITPSFIVRCCYFGAKTVRLWFALKSCCLLNSSFWFFPSCFSTFALFLTMIFIGPRLRSLTRSFLRRGTYKKKLFDFLPLVFWMFGKISFLKLRGHPPATRMQIPELTVGSRVDY